MVSETKETFQTRYIVDSERTKWQLKRRKEALAYVSGLAAETVGLTAAFCQRGTGMDALSR